MAPILRNIFLAINFTERMLLGVAHSQSIYQLEERLLLLPCPC